MRAVLVRDGRWSYLGIADVWVHERYIGLSCGSILTSQLNSARLTNTLQFTTQLNFTPTSETCSLSSSDDSGAKVVSPSLDN
jgi:hypothetical protein